MYIYKYVYICVYTYISGLGPDGENTGSQKRPVAGGPCPPGCRTPSWGSSPVRFGFKVTISHNVSIK